MLKDPGAVKVFIASWANFNFSCTGADRWDKAMAKVPFFVHMVTNPSEMTQFADIVLPATLNSAEGLSIVTNMGNSSATRRSSRRPSSGCGTSSRKRPR